MVRTASLWLFVLASLLAVSGAAAADVPVGRSTVQTGAGWRVFALPDRGVDYGGDVQGTIPSETKVFVHESADNILNAVVIVRASSSSMGQGTMEYSPQCKGDGSVLAVGNKGFNQRYAECWVVSGKQDPPSILKSLAPRVWPALDKLRLPESLVVIVSSYANFHGSFLNVTLFLAPTFAGREGQFNAPLPDGVELRFALLGQDVAKAVRDSVNSFSGKFTFPPMTFSK